MRKFILHITLFIIISFVAILSVAKVSSEIVMNRDFPFFSTESVTLVMDQDQQFDLLFMGISHARNFSRHGNHKHVEKILNKKISNIGQGGGLVGAIDQHFYLDYFYSQGNKVDTLIYVASVPLLWIDYLNHSTRSFKKEAFAFDFFFKYLFYDAPNKSKRLQQYISSKFESSWLNYKPQKKPYVNTRKLDSINWKEVERGYKLTYKNGMIQENFDKNCKVVEQSIKLAQKNNTKVIMIVPPALFGEWKGHTQTIEFLKRMQENYGVEWYDFAKTVNNPAFYKDHHHLNSKGVIYFTEEFLKPVLN